MAAVLVDTRDADTQKGPKPHRKPWPSRAEPVGTRQVWGPASPSTRDPKTSCSGCFFVMVSPGSEILLVLVGDEELTLT